MEILLSAFVGELTSRSINFIINKCSKPPPPPLAMEASLQRALLRAQVIVDEAMARHITNQAMLHQLDMLTDTMLRGHYTLDVFRYVPHDREEAKDQIAVSHSSPLSKVNFIKDYFCFSTGTISTQILGEMQEVLDSLSSMILNVNELIQFLASYPRLYRQPYSMHLLLGNCMFGRQMEAQLVINFLLDTQPHRADEDLEVLPIVGPGRVGKSTLVGHVCNDERVRDHFSQIVFLSDHDLTDDEPANFSEGCVVKHHNRTLNSNKDGRLLLVVEVAGDLNEDAWNRLYSASKRWVPSGSKVIITSRSDKITKLGTTQTLNLKYLSHEAYWYLFKTLAFGSTDPETHPRLVHVAMEIARMLNGTLIGANITARLLRNNFDISFWHKVLMFMRGFIKKHVSKFGEHPSDVLNEYRAAYFGRIGTTSEEIMVYHQYQRSSQEEVPKIMFQDVLYGSARAHGRFEALAWRSQIPPYYNYIYACEILELKTTAVKRKR